MATATVDLSEILKDVPAGAWVAISEVQQEVVAYGMDLPTVLHESQSKGEGHPLILRAPDRNSAMFY